MAAFWLQPIAWWGLATLALPILIHLLARQQSKRVPFPSLRFVPRTQLAALTRKRVSDGWLLATRLAILALAVAALASPVLVSSARREAWNARIVRAIVVAPFRGGYGDEGRAALNMLIDEARADSHASAVFRPTHAVSDGLRSAATWLARQAPAAREVVIVGDLRAGALMEEELAIIPAYAGLRLLPLATERVQRDVTLRGIAAHDESSPASRVDVNLLLEDASTRVTSRMSAESPAAPIEVRAPAAERSRADAALRAVLAEGVMLPHENRRVVVELDGAETPASSTASVVDLEPWMRIAMEQLPGMNGRVESGALVVRPGVSANDVSAPHAIARIVKAAWTDDASLVTEPRRIPPATLAAWSRPSGPPPDVLPADEGDRRWLWGAALLLLAIEYVLRRRSQVTAVANPTAGDTSEVRVA